MALRIVHNRNIIMNNDILLNGQFQLVIVFSPDIIRCPDRTLTGLGGQESLPSFRCPQDCGTTLVLKADLCVLIYVHMHDTY